MIIDAHVHITDNGKFRDIDWNATLESLLKEMKRADIGKAVLMPFPPYTNNKYIANICREKPDIFIGFGHFDNFSESNIKKQFKEFIKWGFKGIKIHPSSQGISLRDKRLDIIFKLCQNNGFCVVIDSFLRSSKILLEEMTPYEIDRIAKKYPNLKIIIAHMGASRVMDALFVAKSNKNVYLEASIILDYFKGSSIIYDAEYAFRHLDQKIVFGSDFPEIMPIEYIKLMKKHLGKYKDCDLEAIFSKNILKIIRW
jgi:predicted TIM-barrel fold metal-dependent hydrolase